MGLYEYMMLSDEDQWIELWANGEHLENMVCTDNKFSLYALHRFFVQVEISNKNKIVAKKEFKTGELLDKWTV